MARGAERQAARIRRAEARGDAAEVDAELRYAEQQLKLAQHHDRAGDGRRVRAQPLRHFAQDAVHLAHLFFVQPHQFVVQLNGVERFDEHGVAAAAGAVDDAVDFALLAGHDGHHETLVADGDEILAQNAVLVMRAQEAFERSVNLLLLLFDVAAQARERQAGVIGQRTVGQEFAGQLAHHAAEVAQLVRLRAEQREAFARGQKDGAQVACAIEQFDEFQDFLGFQSRAFDAQFLHGLGRIRHVGEARARHGGARGRLGAGGRAEIFHGLGHFGVAAFQRGPVRGWLDLARFGLAQRARRVTLHQALQRVEFEQGGTPLTHDFLVARKARRMTASVPSVMRYFPKLRSSTHSTRLTSSPAASAPPLARHT